MHFRIGVLAALAGGLGMAQGAMAAKVVVSAAGSVSSSVPGIQSGHIQYNSDGPTLTQDPSAVVGYSNMSTDGSAYDYQVAASTGIQPSFSGGGDTVGMTATASAIMSNGTIHTDANGAIGTQGGSAQAEAEMHDTITFHNAAAVGLGVTVTWSIDGSVSHLMSNSWNVASNASLGLQQESGSSVTVNSEGNTIQYGFGNNANGGPNNFTNMSDDPNETPVLLEYNNGDPTAVAMMTVYVPSGDSQYQFDESLTESAGIADLNYGNTASVSLTLPPGGLVTYSASAFGQAVPEPVSIGLLGLSAMICARRRKH